MRPRAKTTASSRASRRARATELLGIVGAHNPAAAVEGRGLENARVRHFRGDCPEIVAGREEAEPGAGHTSRRHQRAHAVFVARSLGGSRGVVGQPQPRGHGGGGHDAAVVHREHGGERLFGCGSVERCCDHGGGSVRVVQVHAQPARSMRPLLALHGRGQVVGHENLDPSLGGRGRNASLR